MRYFGTIRKLARQYIKLKPNEISFEIASRKDTQELIIRLNTRRQLFQQGINAQGTRLDQIGGSYSEATIRIKRQDNLPTDRVTLFQTGEFYGSFNVRPYRGGFYIEADTIKEGEDLQTRWSNEILGLTDESKTILAEYYTNEIAKLITQRAA